MYGWRSFVLVLVALISLPSFASKIERLNVWATEKNGLYTTYTDAIVVGDYNRYIKRMLDAKHHPHMGMPYFKKNIIVRKNKGSAVLWSHMKTFPVNFKYYTKVNTSIGKKTSRVKWRLIKNRGYGYPEDHGYLRLNGYSTVKLISSNKKGQRFKVRAVSYIKFRSNPSFGKGIAIKKMKNVARTSVKVFAD